MVADSRRGAYRVMAGDLPLGRVVRHRLGGWQGVAYVAGVEQRTDVCDYPWAAAYAVRALVDAYGQVPLW